MVASESIVERALATRIGNVRGLKPEVEDQSIWSMSG